MEVLIIIGVILAGILFFLIEVFIIPGSSIAGICSAICLLFANYYAFSELGVSGGLITLAITTFGGVSAIVWFMKSNTVDKLSLKKEIDYNMDKLQGINIKVGDKGVALTRLALIGNADFNGDTIEVKSNDGFIDEKEPVYVERIAEHTVFVRKVK
ncbi:MAG: NfeD family protein [Phocaeicola sp.]